MYDIRYETNHKQSEYHHENGSPQLQSNIRSLLELK